MSIHNYINPWINLPAPSTGESLVIPSHIQQMQMWSVRKGLEFYPSQDTEDKQRLRLIQSIIESNQLDLYYKSIVSSFLCSGGILWYLRPTGTSTYQILWYDKNHYKVYHDPNGLGLQKVVICYKYYDNSQPVFTSGSFNHEKWIRLKITAQQLIVERFNTKPSVDEDNYSQHYANTLPISSETFQNTLGFIPCVESPNEPGRPGEGGVVEFSRVSNQLMAVDEVNSSILRNLYMFGSPTLVTSKPREQVVEQYNAIAPIAGNLQYSWSARQGYQSASTINTMRATMPSGQLAGTLYGQGGWVNKPSRVASIIGNIKERDRFAYLQVDPVSNDQQAFAEQYREQLHEALGGIDPLGRTQTFGELKSLHGKVAATAENKCLSLWTYGLAKILELAIYVEEQLFLSSFAVALIESKVVKQEDLSEDLILGLYEQGVVPPGIVGIPPNGKREVKWRFKGPVFEDSPKDKLELSIVTRNLQELGVGSLEAMKILFPDKTENEIKGLLTGVPFRYIQQTIQSISSLLQLQQQMFVVADPQDPAMPLAGRFDVTPIIGYALNNLMREISYGANYESSTNAPAAAIPAISPGNPIPGSTPGDSLPWSPDTPSSAPAANSNSLRPASGSVPGTPGSAPDASAAIPGNRPDFFATLPSPGTTIANGAATANAGYRPNPVATSSVPVDIAATPGLLAQLYPDFFKSGAANGKRNAKRTGK